MREQGFVVSYIRFLLQSPKWLCFGILLTFFSSFGQTFFISFSVPDWLETFGLSNTEWGAIYSGATLISASLLPKVGKSLDARPLKSFSLAVAAGLIVSCLAVSLAFNAVTLLVCVLGLRFTGQGLMGLTASTSMARQFPEARGKALSVTALGFPMGEILFPLFAVPLLQAVGWRMHWRIWALFGALALFSLIPYLLKSSRAGEGRGTEPGSDKSTRVRHWTRREVLGDPRFYFIVPAYMMMAFAITGLVLNQSALAREKGWAMEVMFRAFVGFGLARFVSVLFVGPLIDRFSARRLFPFHLLPAAAGMWLLDLMADPGVALGYYALMGISMGMASSCGTALWAELYGLRHLGAIKGLTSMLAVFSTSSSPFLFGLALDAGLDFDLLLPATATVALLVSVSCWFGCRDVRDRGKPVVIEKRHEKH